MGGYYLLIGIGLVGGKASIFFIIGLLVEAGVPVFSVVYLYVYRLCC